MGIGTHNLVTKTEYSDISGYGGTSCSEAWLDLPPDQVVNSNKLLHEVKSTSFLPFYYYISVAVAASQQTKPVKDICYLLKLKQIYYWLFFPNQIPQQMGWLTQVGGGMIIRGACLLLQ